MHKRQGPGRPPLDESAKVDKHIKTLEIRSALEEEEPKHLGKDRLIQAKRAIAKRRGTSLGAVRSACKSKDSLVLALEKRNRVRVAADKKPIAKSPTMSPPPGRYADPQRIKLSCDTKGAVIHYKLNDKFGNPTEWKRYQKGIPLPIDANTTVEAYAEASGHRQSRHAGGVYILGKNVRDKAAMIKMAHQCEPEPQAVAQFRVGKSNYAKIKN
jgi:hypothetical protein